jgi:hypothetical protein
MCLSLEPYDVERIEQQCHFTSRSELIITWFTLPSLFSSFITQSLNLPVTLFLSANNFCGGSLSRGTYATPCIL